LLTKHGVSGKYTPPVGFERASSRNATYRVLELEPRSGQSTSRV
jgi:hypothetical protein